MTLMTTRNAALAAACAAAVLMTGCASGSGAAPATSTPAATSAAPSQAPSVTPGVVPGSALPAGLEITPPEGWRDTAEQPDHHHWLAPNVVTDAEKERWADMFVYVPMVAFDPELWSPIELPADPAAWMREHPALEIVGERTVQVNGVEAAQIDVQTRLRSVPLFAGGTAAPELTPGPGERFTFVPLENGWLIVEASTLRPNGLTEKETATDALAAVLASIKL